MRFTVLTALAAGLMVSAAAARAETCADPANALGVSRVVEIDTANGPLYGDATKRAKEPTFLAPKEIVLTFDDGPVPWITGPILDTLDKFCTKATFFSVGEMAMNYPGVVKDVVARGHTLASHTYTHPLNLRRLTLEKATNEIERGLAAVTLAAGSPIAPFFRFPGLSDSDPLLAHLQKRGIASFTVDVISNDSYIGNPQTLTKRVIRLAEARQGGILLFHDIKMATAKALPAILTELKARGFKVVHMKPKATAVPVADYDEDLKTALAKAVPKYVEAPTSMPVPIKTPEGQDPAVAALTPEARQRVAEAPAVPTGTSATPPGAPKVKTTQRRLRARAGAAGGQSLGDFFKPSAL